MRRLLWALLALALTTTTARAEYPERPIRIIVAYAAGGTSDILARAIGQKLTETLGQPVVVENRTGANGNIGAEYVARSRPDGYTLLLTDAGAVVINASLYPNLPFDTERDLAAVLMIGYAPHIFAVHPSVPATTLQEFIAYARANPGRINVANGGVGSTNHLAEVLFRQRTGINWTEVPYRGGAPAITATVAGETQGIFLGTTALAPLVQSGQLRALGLSGPSRWTVMPQLPTIIEGGVPDFISGTWQGIWAPGGTPPELLNRINAEVQKVLSTPDMRQRLAEQGADLMPGTPADFATWMRENIALWRTVVRDANLRGE